MAPRNKPTVEVDGRTTYLNKGEMMRELIDYNESGVISNTLGAMFMKIAERYTSRRNLSGYSYREDMIGEAVTRMVSQIDKFDINHPAANPFAYFTQVAHNQILALLNREKRQRDIKSNLRDKMWSELCEDEGLMRTEQRDEDSGYED